MINDLIITEANICTPEENKMMASFRIDRELWAKFGKLAKSERLTATDILTDYIQRCTDNDKSQCAVKIDTYDTDKLNDIVIMMVNTAIEVSLQSSLRVMIESELEPITEQVKEVKSFTQIQLQSVRDELEKALNSIMSETKPEKATQSLQTSAQKIMEADRILSIKQQGTLVEKVIEAQVDPPLIQISTNSQDKLIANTVKSLETETKSVCTTANDSHLTRDIKRWLERLKDKKFSDIIHAAISDKLSNKDLVTRLFAAGYGKNDNTEPYPPNLGSAMKTALKIQNSGQPEFMTAGS